MFIGHFAVGLAGKRFAPAAPLTWLLVAPAFLDVLWPVFVLTGIEVARIDPGNTAFTPLDLAYMPWSHSLVMAIVWSIVFALVYRSRHIDRRGAAVLGVLVFSHWVLDWVTHRPDMGIAPGVETRVGLGLWNSIPATMITEVALLAIGAWLYASATTPTDRTGRRSFAALIVFLVVVYVGVAFGPPPPNMVAVTVSALVMTALLVAWAAWIERHRVAV